MGLLDSIIGPRGGGGLLDSLLYPNSQLYPPQQMSQAQPILSANQPSPLDTAQWPQGPVGAPSRSPQPPRQSVPDYGQTSNIPIGGGPNPYMMPVFGSPDATTTPQSAQPVQYQQPQAQPQDQSPSFGDHLLAGLDNFGNARGILPALVNGLQGLITGKSTTPLGLAQQQQALQRQQVNMTVQALRAKGVDPASIAAAVSNPEAMKAIVTQTFGPQTVTSLGNGYVAGKDGKITRAYEPDDKTPNSVLEYKYYLDNLPKGQQPMDYATFTTAKARAGATNVTTNIDPNSGQTYDKQLAEGLGKAHASLANGVEDAQGRARDLAAMQGAIDSIQARGGTTGGLGQQQILDLQKTINSGLSSLGIDKTFNESDISDKEFLTKFNRMMAGAQAKNAVGSRVTNFEMSNYLKANPGLDMSPTGNQRLIGIQSQIEQRNIAVGNAIRDATAHAIAAGQKIDPVTVQKIVTDYDAQHHIQDPITGQDLTQNYVLPEFQKVGTNPALAAQHNTNVSKIRRYNPQTNTIE